VTAHEFGHNWGSEHDPDVPECSPGASQGGSFLMYTYSVSGYDVNNKRFSPCSLRSIRKVLQAKSGRCFSEPEESFCGNLRVEGDEECDAGLLGTEDNDPCCDKNCRLRRAAGVACSDKNSPCCQVLKNLFFLNEIILKVFFVGAGLPVHGVGNTMSRGAVRDVRAGLSVHGHVARLSALAAHVGRHAVPGAWTVPPRQVRALLRDHEPPELHV